MLPIYIALIGAIGFFLGFAITKLTTLTPRAIQFLQHLVMGVILGALGTELIPQLQDAQTSTLFVIIGIALGAVFFALLQAWSPKESNSLTPFFSALGVDLLVDGFLIPIAFLATTRGGIIVGVALCLEALCLGLVSFTSCRSLSSRQQIALALVCGAALPLGAIAASLLLTVLPHSIITVFLAFACTALIFLVVEELSEEAHEGADTPWMSSSLFLGFALVFVVP